VTLVKATIQVLDADAVDPGRGLPEKIEVQFNPNQYQLEKAAQLAEIGIPGIDSPLLQFVRGQNERLTLELFFDTTDGGTGDSAQDVREQTKQIYQLVKMQPRTHAPPRVLVSWSPSLSFKAVVETVRQTFTLFSPSGVPLRATVNVTFREYKTLEDQLAELNLQSSDRTRQRTIRGGDTLSDIAAEMYGVPTAWRHIADFNSSRLPSVIDLPPGVTLLIPPLPSGVLV
jgi:nucleoid-associated protein YgaU